MQPFPFSFLHSANDAEYRTFDVDSDQIISERITKHMHVHHQHRCIRDIEIMICFQCYPIEHVSNYIHLMLHVSSSCRHAGGALERTPPSCGSCDTTPVCGTHGNMIPLIHISALKKKEKSMIDFMMWRIVRRQPAINYARKASIER